MKEYGTDAIRNIALIGHGGAGKTSLVEAFLYFTGATTRLGRVEDGTAIADYEDEEQRRRISISSAQVVIEHNNVKINVLDTPGFTDFVGEVKSALQVADAAIVVVDAVSGVEVGTELVWDFCEELGLPRFIVINKLDRDNADFQQALASVQQLAEDKKLVPATLPWGEGQDLQGVIGLLSRKARAGTGKEEQDIPAEFAEATAAARTELEEAAAEGDDDLLMKYLDGEALSNADIELGFKLAVAAGSFVPVFACAATAEIGIGPLLAGIQRYIPSPAERGSIIAQNGSEAAEEIKAEDGGPLGVYAFKTTADPFVGRLTYMRVMSGVLDSDTRVWNHTKSTEQRIGTLHVMRGKEQISVTRLHAGDIGIVAKLGDTVTGDSLGDKAKPLHFSQPTYPGSLYSVAVRPRTQTDQAKMGPTLARLCEEDPTLHWHNQPSTLETILEGMGDQHIDVAMRRAEDKFGTGIDTKTPRVPYQETITRVANSRYRHKKQTGGAGQFGEVHLRVEPLDQAEKNEKKGHGDDNFWFVNQVFGGSISSGYMTAIEKGVTTVMRDGVIAGYPVGKIFVAVTDGKEHPVDSKPIAFEIAAREAFKLAVQDANPVLLEPIMNMAITVPETNMGDVLSDMNSRRARVLGMDNDEGKSIVTAEVPLAEVQRYVTELRSITQGRGVFAMEYLRHEQVPTHIAQDVIDHAKREAEED